MSDLKEATGICEAITEKNGWTEFAIGTGGQYPVKLSTKLEPLIVLGRAAGQHLATWSYKEVESEKINEHTGKPFVNKYLEGVEIGGTQTPPNANVGSSATEPHHPPLIAGDKDRAITRMSCLKTAAGMYQGALGLNDVDNDLLVIKVMDTARRFERFVYRDIQDVPFE